jgi:hypothetical protein
MPPPFYVTGRGHLVSELGLKPAEDYQCVSPRSWDSLGELDDLRAFAGAADRLAREG